MPPVPDGMRLEMTLMGGRENSLIEKLLEGLLETIQHVQILLRDLREFFSLLSISAAIAVS